MKKLLFPRWCWGLVLGLLVSLVLMGLRPLPVAAQVDSRLTQLEFEVRAMRSQLSQLESLVGRAGGSVRPPPPSSPPVPGVPGDPSLETQFDNLATLAIELKQQVRALESRVSQLEQRAS